MSAKKTNSTALFSSVRLDRTLAFTNRNRFILPEGKVIQEKPHLGLEDFLIEKERAVKIIDESYLSPPRCRMLGRVCDFRINPAAIYYYVMHLNSIYNYVHDTELNGDILLRPLALVYTTEVISFLISEVILLSMTYQNDCNLDRKVDDAHFPMMAVQSIKLDRFINHDDINKNVKSIDIHHHEYENMRVLVGERVRPIFSMNITYQSVVHFTKQISSSIREKLGVKASFNRIAKEYMHNLFFQLVNMLFFDILTSGDLQDSNIIVQLSDITSICKNTFSEILTKERYERLEACCNSKINLAKAADEVWII
jgi:hypothetical protein